MHIGHPLRLQLLCSHLHTRGAVLLGPHRPHPDWLPLHLFHPTHALRMQSVLQDVPKAAPEHPCLPTLHASLSDCLPGVLLCQFP